jgi:hypothetical protein
MRWVLGKSIAYLDSVSANSSPVEALAGPGWIEAVNISHRGRSHNNPQVIRQV